MEMEGLPKEKMYPKRGWKFDYNKRILTESTVNYAGGKFSKYQILNIPRDDERVIWCYCNEVRQRAISKAEYEYDIACRQAGWEMGGLFTPQPSALPSNIRCLTSSKRAIGYIGCSQNYATKRVYVEGTKISRILPKPGESIKLDKCSESDCANMVYNDWVLYEWVDTRLAPTGKLTTIWGLPEDFDVRLHGATIDKPDYMPPFDN